MTDTSIFDKYDPIVHYATYDDRLSDKQVQRILSSEDPYVEFYDILVESYDEADYLMRKDIIDEIVSEYGLSEDEAASVVEDIPSEYPTDHFLNHEYCVDIFLDAGDADYDFIPNVIYPHYCRSLESLDHIEETSSVRYLAELIGYTEQQVIDYFRGSEIDDSTFLGSLYTELENCTTSINTVVFMRRMNLSTLLDTVHSNNVSIPAGTTCGLFDEWCGAGGSLEIKVDKNLVIPKSKIFKITIDNTLKYSIHDVYCVSDSLWK